MQLEIPKQIPHETIEHKALCVIDRLCINVEDGADAKKVIDIIYRLAHSTHPTSCYEVHDNWRQEVERMYLEYAA